MSAFGKMSELKTPPLLQSVPIEAGIDCVCVGFWKLSGNIEQSMDVGFDVSCNCEVPMYNSTVGQH